MIITHTFAVIIIIKKKLNDLSLSFHSAFFFQGPNFTFNTGNSVCHYAIFISIIIHLNLFT